MGWSWRPAASTGSLASFPSNSRPPRAPESADIRVLIDSHCHLADPAFSDDLSDVVARARAAGLRRAMCIIASEAPEEIARAEHVQQAWPDVVFATAVHPQHAGDFA